MSSYASINPLAHGLVGLLMSTAGTFQGQRPERKQGVGMVMPLYSTEVGIAQGGTMAWPGMTTAFEKMVVPAKKGIRFSIYVPWCSCVMQQIFSLCFRSVFGTQQLPAKLSTCRDKQCPWNLQRQRRQRKQGMHHTKYYVDDFVSDDFSVTETHQWGWTSGHPGMQGVPCQ